MKIPTVTINKRKLKDRRVSIYLSYRPAITDPITKKDHAFETLGVYLWDKPRNDIEKEFNKQAMLRVEGIKAQRIISIIDNEFDFFDAKKRSGDFLLFFSEFCTGRPPMYRSCLMHFTNFTKGRCRFQEVTVDLCNRFQKYLLSKDYISIQNPHKNKRLSNNAVNSYMSVLRSVVSTAWKQSLIKDYPFRLVRIVRPLQGFREYLTLEEVKTLAHTPCQDEVLKKAALFSCLTGLRYSDVTALTHKNLYIAPEGGFCLRLHLKKTKKELTIPISDEAVEILGRVRKKGFVFDHMTERPKVNRVIGKWVEAAGINKHITFHCFRHTFATTVTLTNGVPIETVSKLLGHRSIRTTQIYAKVINEKIAEDMGSLATRIDGKFELASPKKAKPIMTMEEVMERTRRLHPDGNFKLKDAACYIS